MDPINQPKALIGNTMAETLQISSVMAALAASATEVHEQGDYFHAVVPQGYKLEDISKAVEKMQECPRRKSGTVQLKDLDSLLLYCADQAKAETSDGAALGYIYADPEDRKSVV